MRGGDMVGIAKRGLIGNGCNNINETIEKILECYLVV